MELVRTRLVSNAAKPRRVTHEGREYIVAPLSLIVPGVLNGSKGALYYPPDEVGRVVDAWNGIPIVVNHPFEAGRPVSARSPSVLERYGIGHVYAARMAGKLTAEGWFDVAKVRAVNPAVLSDLSAGRP